MKGTPTLARESMQVKSIQLDLSPDDGAVLLSAQFVIDLSAALKDAIERGLPLHFLTEYEIYRPRLLWFDEQTVEGQLEWRLSYHALTRQYHLSSARGSESFATLDEAIAQMTSLRDWTVTTIGQLQPGKDRRTSTPDPRHFQGQTAWKGMLRCHAAGASHAQDAVNAELFRTTSTTHGYRLGRTAVTGSTPT